MKKEFRTTEATTYLCRYHVMFCPKYRRKVLREEIAQRFIEIASSIQQQYNFIIEDMDVQIDSVYLLLNVDPTIGINKVVSKIKAHTANVLTKEFPELRSKLPTLWTRAKLITTLGSLDQDMIDQFYKDQKTNEQRKKK